MAVHRLFPPTTPPTPPPTTPVRRSPRLRSHCILATRKRASPEHQPKLLPLTPEPSPRCIRAQKRQKILDASSSPPKTRTRKRKALIPDDDQHRAVKKKRKENIVNDALTATAATSSLKITLDLDTRQGAGSSVCYCLSSYSLSRIDCLFLTIASSGRKEHQPITTKKVYQIFIFQTNRLARLASLQINLKQIKAPLQMSAETLAFEDDDKNHEERLDLSRSRSHIFHSGGTCSWSPPHLP